MNLRAKAEELETVLIHQAGTPCAPPVNLSQYGRDCMRAALEACFKETTPEGDPIGDHVDALLASLEEKHDRPTR